MRWTTPALAALALTACTQVADVTRATVHPMVDRYCAETPAELRSAARLGLGTTEAGNRILVDCAGAAVLADPKAPSS